MTETEYKVGSLQARFEELSGDVALLKRDVADLRTEMRDMTRRQGQDFRLLATAMLAVIWMVMFGLMAKGFGWLR